jgi:tripartite-type tricarboxylate transporter receptor subunit TctC
MKRNVLLCAVILIAVISQVAAQGVAENPAENYWNESITMVVHAGAGGNLDVKVRLVAKYLEQIVGKPVIIENVAGGGGITAATQYLEEKPNTHKILVMSDAMFSIAPKFNRVVYTMDDYIPIIGLDVVKAVMYANREKVKDFDDMKQLVASREVLIGDNGKASGSYLSQAAALTMMGGTYRSVTYASAPETLTSIFAGNIDFGWGAVNVGQQFVQNGSLTPVMVFSEDPFTFADGTVAPTAQSLGLDVIQENFIFFAIRKGSDPRVVEVIEEALSKVYANAQFVAEAQKMSMFLAPTNAQQTKEKVEQIVTDYEQYFSLIGN